jgi:NTP pyrophosphatase (non-canonical NTP hydrolase)
VVAIMSQEDLESGRVTVAELQTLVTRFRNERGWERLHTPENLAKALVVEASELLEIFLWQTDRPIDEKIRAELSGEMADVFAYLLGLAESTGIDLSAALTEKLRQNAFRFPIRASAANEIP